MADRRPARRRASTQSVQAVVEGVAQEGEIVDDGRTVEFMGASFRMAQKIGLMPLLKFAHASNQGIDSNDMAGLIALYDMIHDCIDDEGATEEDPDSPEWKRFQAYATRKKAEADDLMTLVQRVIEKVAARPTPPPGDSSAGRRKTSANSRASSSAPVLEGMTSVADLDR